MRIQRVGSDGVSNFKIVTGTCDCCEEVRSQLVLTYCGEIHYHKWTWDDVLAKTVLGKANHNRNSTETDRILRPRLGLQCGCYGKFQRQLARITQAVEHKSAVS